MLLNLIFLRIFAILLIVNSHLGHMYPYSQLGFGGFLGNSIFYLISGVGLTMSFQRRPVSAITWYRKRIIKVGIPLLLFMAILNIGNLQGFLASVYHRIIWHDIQQLNSFLPVLWGLYLLFLPINRMHPKQIIVCMTLLLTVTSGLFVYTINTVQNIPHELPSNEMFFPLNALACFMLGIYFSKTNILPSRLTRHKSTALLCIAAIVFSQGMHQVFSYLGGKYIPINFFLNLTTVYAFYILSQSIDLKLSNNKTAFLYSLASSSLAVYLVQFKMIKIIDVTNIEFPYNVVSLYLYTFIFSYALTRMSGFLTNRVISGNQ